MIEAKFPKPDSERQQRIVNDVLQLLKLRTTAVVTSGGVTFDPYAQVCRWLQHVLNKAKSHNSLPWWFARRSFSFVIYAGQDVFDFQHKVDRLLGVICKGNLEQRSMEWITQRRCEAQGCNNAGIPQYYCEFGGRLHLYPAPKEALMLSVFYTVPLTCDIVPDEWETVLVDGVIGLYGGHFDRSGVVGEVVAFEKRFWASLDETRQHDHDAYLHYRTPCKGDCSAQVESLSTAMAMANAGDPPEDAILTPSFQDKIGAIQILADEDHATDNKHGTPFAQIPGDYQP